MAEEFEALQKLIFFLVLTLLGLLEFLGSVRREPVQREIRWVANGSLFLIDNAVVGIVMPIGIIVFAMDQPPRLMSTQAVPVVAQFLLTFLLLDFWHYWQHRLCHTVPFLWRCHLVHHSDTCIDITTSQRHHPFEALLNAALVLTLVYILGLPAAPIGVYLLVASTVALLSHANLRLPTQWEQSLGQVIVTPSFHAVHHSALKAQTNSNYSMVLTVWDRLFGTYNDPAKNPIERFGLEYFHQTRDTRIVQVLLQPFLFHSGLAYSGHETISSASAQIETVRAQGAALAISDSWKKALYGSAAGTVLSLLVLWPTISTLLAAWQGNEAYRYGFLVMPMVIYLLGWHFRDEILASNPSPDFTGVVISIIAAVLWGAAVLMNVNVVAQLAFILTLHGIAMSALGWRGYWRLFPVLALMFLMIPSGDVLQPVLRLLTVKSIEVFAIVAGMPHTIDGFSISIGKLHYFVVDACSGLSYVNLMLFLGYCFGLLLYRSFLRITTLALFSALLGFLSNVIRVNSIILIDSIQGSQMDLAAHGNIQWIALLAVLGLLIYVLGQLSADPIPVMALKTSQKQVSPNAHLAPVAAGIAVLLIAGFAAWARSDSWLAPHQASSDMLPTNILKWRLSPLTGPWSVDRQSETASMLATYHHRDQNMEVVILEMLSANAKLSELMLSPGVPGVWSDVLTKKVASCDDSNCLTLVHTIWKRGNKYPERHMYFAYSIGDTSTDSKLEMRAAFGLSRLIGNGDTPKLIGLTFEGAEPEIHEVATAYRIIQTKFQPPKR